MKTMVLGPFSIPVDGDDEEQPRSVLPEAQIATLKEFHKNYRARRFKPGDIVTPKEGVNMKHAGVPHIVLETNYDAEPMFGGDASSSGYGIRPEMRVLVLFDEHYAPFWVEAWPFEEYDADEHNN